MMSVIDVNMRNLARWVDGVYDTNLLSGSNAVSTNIEGNNGYIVYFSDRRGDRVKSERDSTGVTLSTANGMVDNEDIYGPNNILDPGEDVIDALADGSGVLKRGTLQKDTNELPDPTVLPGAYATDDNLRAKIAAAWMNPNNYFRRSVRLFNAENLQISGAANKLSRTCCTRGATSTPLASTANPPALPHSMTRAKLTTTSEARFQHRSSATLGFRFPRFGSTVPVQSILRTTRSDPATKVQTFHKRHLCEWE